MMLIVYDLLPRLKKEGEGAGSWQIILLWMHNKMLISPADGQLIQPVITSWLLHVCRDQILIAMTSLTSYLNIFNIQYSKTFAYLLPRIISHQEKLKNEEMYFEGIEQELIVLWFNIFRKEMFLMLIKSKIISWIWSQIYSFTDKFWIIFAIIVMF